MGQNESDLKEAGSKFYVKKSLTLVSRSKRYSIIKIYPN